MIELSIEDLKKIKYCSIRIIKLIKSSNRHIDNIIKKRLKMENEIKHKTEKEILEKSVDVFGTEICIDSAIRSAKEILNILEDIRINRNTSELELVETISSLEISLAYLDIIFKDNGINEKILQKKKEKLNNITNVLVSYEQLANRNNERQKIVK